MKLNRFRSSLQDSVGKSDLKKLVLNFFNYGSYQAITYISYLITIPYIVRVIGQANFGIVNLALALISYMAITTEFGFSISGVQYIAQTQQDAQKRREIISNIFALQIVLMLATFVVMFFVVNSIPKFQPYEEVFYYTFLIIPANISMTVWFYLGMEKIKYLNLLNLISKSLYIVCIFLLVKRPEDFYYVPLLTGITASTVGLFSLYLLFFKFGVYPLYLKSINLIQSIKNNWNFFLSILAINLYRNTNVLILGLLANESAAGIYSGGEKIVIVIQSMFAPVTQVIYPYISRLRATEPDKSKKILMTSVLLIGTATLFVSLSLFIFANKIALIVLGEQFVKSGIVIRIASFVVFFGTLNFILGIIFMTNYGMKKEFSKAVMITGLANIIICIILSRLWNVIGTAISFLSAELILTILLLYFIHDKYDMIFEQVFLKMKNAFQTGRQNIYIWFNASKTIRVYSKHREMADGGQAI